VEEDDMADQKGPNLAPGFPPRRPATPTTTGGAYRAAPAEPRPTGDAKDVASVDSYRRWLSRVQLPDKRRIAMDPSLYTWKGYRNWAEKVRRDWTPDE
jgi:hypothetical protein